MAALITPRPGDSSTVAVVDGCDDGCGAHGSTTAATQASRIRIVEPRPNGPPEVAASDVGRAEDPTNPFSPSHAAAFDAPLLLHGVAVVPASFPSPGTADTPLARVPSRLEPETCIAPVVGSLSCGRSHVAPWPRRRVIQIIAVVALMFDLAAIIVIEIAGTSFNDAPIAVRLFFSLLPLSSTLLLLSTYHVGVARRAMKEFEPWYTLLSAVLAVFMIGYVALDPKSPVAPLDTAIVSFGMFNVFLVAMAVAFLDACDLPRWWKVAYVTIIAVFLCMAVLLEKMDATSIDASTLQLGRLNVSFNPVSVYVIALGNFAIFAMKNAIMLLRGSDFVVIRFEGRRRPASASDEVAGVGSATAIHSAQDVSMDTMYNESAVAMRR